MYLKRFLVFHFEKKTYVYDHGLQEVKELNNVVANRYLEFKRPKSGLENEIVSMFENGGY
jgi:hypothetical protein